MGVWELDHSSLSPSHSSVMDSCGQEDEDETTEEEGEYDKDVYLIFSYNHNYVVSRRCAARRLLSMPTF